MDPITIGAMAVGLGSQIFSAIRGGKANTANQNLINRQFAQNESFYNNRANRDFLETNVAKGMFEKLRKNIDDNNKTIDSKAAITGATPEAVIAAKSKNQENYNEAVNSLADKATAYQTGQEAIYRGENSNLVNAQMGLNSQKANNAANVASNAGGLVEGAATLTGFEDVANKPSILGSLGGIQPETREKLNLLKNLGTNAILG